jgi:hypothetical protein
MEISPCLFIETTCDGPDFTDAARRWKFDTPSRWLILCAKKRRFFEDNA